MNLLYGGFFSRIYVGCFVVLLGPFTFFNVTKTKYLQLATTILRWTAFTFMVALSIRRLLDRYTKMPFPFIMTTSFLKQLAICARELKKISKRFQL